MMRQQKVLMFLTQWKNNKLCISFLGFRLVNLAFQKIVRGKKGVSIVEILIVVVIIAVALTSLLSLTAFLLRASILIKDTAQAKNLAEETVEQVRNFRDGTAWNSNGLGTLLTGEINPYHLEKDLTVSPPKWKLVSGEQAIDGFKRKVIFSDVQRDSDDNIVESGGVSDPGTKKVKATVSWEKMGSLHQIEIVTYLTNWR